jgi:hypothetical protein
MTPAVRTWSHLATIVWRTLIANTALSSELENDSQILSDVDCIGVLQAS